MNISWNNDVLLRKMVCGSGSTLHISRKHFKHLENSICWNYKGNEALILSKDIGYQGEKNSREDKKLQAFSFWVYNESPLDGVLNLSFMTDDQKCCEFDFGLDYTGWRTCWVLYDRDMVGRPSETMNRLVITPPESVHSGELFISEIITATWIDPRYPTADLQTPYVNPDTGANGHWLDLLYYWKQAIPPCDTSSLKDYEDLKVIENRYIEDLLNHCHGKTDMGQIRSRYAAYGIKLEAESMTGRSIDSVYYHDIIPQETRADFIKATGLVDLKETLSLLKDMAVIYNTDIASEDKAVLEDMFSTLVRYLMDQGFAAASSLGTTHHCGYVIRAFYEAAFLMKDVLRKSSLLKPVRDTMAWYAALNRIFCYERASASNIDILNTLAQGMVATILMMEEGDTKVHYMKWYAKWVAYCLKPAPGLRGTFKVDGCAFHHGNLYPAYALDGMKGITPVIYYLSRTSFRITEDAHYSIRKAVLAMRLYSNKRNWLVALSGRHPKGEGPHTELSLMPYKYLALAGTPDGQDIIDAQMASAYLRLASDQPTTSAGANFQADGLAAEMAPTGHFTMNYGCLALHRREDWLVGIKGHSRYLWGSETYGNANLYGRYISYGQIQVLGQGEPITNRGSGYVTDGFNWNRWPGTTAIQLPFEELKADVRNVDHYSGHEEMLLSDQIYAGGLNIEGHQGMFAMKVHEHDKYDGSHYANISVFCFDNRILCLGSDISNEDYDHVTQTTLFQNCLQVGEDVMVSSHVHCYRGTKMKQSFEGKDIYLMDNKCNGYYIPGGQRLELMMGEQASRSQDKDEVTAGEFVCAVLDHGCKPKESGYEYVMLIDTDDKALRAFADAMSGSDPLYSVLAKTSYLHAVRDHTTGITAYSVFDSSKPIGIGSLIKSDKPCMIMIKDSFDRMKLSLVDPDLRLYDGLEPDQYDSDGSRREVSVYSRPWFGNESQESELILRLKGQWALEGEPYKVTAQIIDNNTTVSFRCQHAQPMEIELRRME